MIITDNTPLAMMTVGQLKEVIRETKAAEEQQPARTHKYAYGLEGIRQLFGVGLNTAQKYKDGILKDAVMQHGRKIIVDVDKAMELYQQHCTNK